MKHYKPSSQAPFRKNKEISSYNQDTWKTSSWSISKFTIFLSSLLHIGLLKSYETPPLQSKKYSPSTEDSSKRVKYIMPEDSRQILSQLSQNA